MDNHFKLCTQCVMDTTDPDIIFDENGVCNHCSNYYKQGQIFFTAKEEKYKALDKLTAEIKKKGRDKPYDCVIGVSGGVDSTYVAYKVKELGLRPLAVHLDNGWNSELAVSNIERTMKVLGIDLLTHVIDWDEFRDLQLAFLKASCVDIEILTDHALMASLFNTAAKKRIQYIVWGTNFATESVMPASWNHWKFDLKNIKSIHHKFGNLKLKTFPQMSIVKFLFYKLVLGIKTISLLDYLDYDKEQAMAILKEKLCWKKYDNKHDESVFTKFYQDYILPKKFKIDKRKAHYSSMINSGQMEREEALALLKKEDPLVSAKTIETKRYFLKKMDIDEDCFEAIMSLPVKKHTDYPNHIRYYNIMSKAYKFFSKERS